MREIERPAGRHPGGATEKSSDHFRKSTPPPDAAQAGAPDPEDIPAPPVPLRRELPPASEFPTHALGPILAPAARALHSHVQAPVALCGNAILGAAALAVQGHADVDVPGAGRRPVSLFLVTVAASGERKTSVDNLALRAVRERERELALDHARDLESWRVEQGAWDATSQHIRRNKKNYPTHQARVAALRELGPAPPPPLVPMVTCAEPTSEGLVHLLRDGQPGIGIFSSEGGQFLGGHAMSDDHRLKTVAALSSLWDASPVTRVRRGDGSFVLYGRRLALHLQMQPAVAAGLLGDPLLRDQGLLSRLLVAAPDSTAGTRFWREPDPSAAADLAAYHVRLAALLRRPLPLAEGARNALDPPALTFDPRARRAWCGFMDEVEGELADGGEYAVIRAFAAKLPEHAARIAAVIQLVDDPAAGAIGKTDIERGITLAQFYAMEAVRLHEAGADDPDLVLAERVLTWLHTTWPEPLVSLPDIYRHAPTRAIRSQSAARRIVGILERHGWVAKLVGPADVAGQRRREAWMIVEKVRAATGARESGANGET